MHAIAVVLFAKILGHVGDVRRFPTALGDPGRRRQVLATIGLGHLVRYTGTSPLDASSGNRNRHRLNSGGNRQLNSAPHTIAVCQARDPRPGRVYYLRKLAEGKTPTEARRVLKRRLANVTYRHIHKDQQRRPTQCT